MSHSNKNKGVWSWRDAVLQSNLSSTQKHIALTISVYMNERGNGAFPSYATLSQDASLGRTTVIRAVNALCEASFLSKESNLRKNGSTSSNRYACTYPQWAKNTYQNKPGVVSQEHQGGVTGTLGGVSQEHQGGVTVTPHINTPYDHSNLNTPLNKKNPEKKEPKNLPTNFDDLFETFWAAYGRIGNKKPTRLKFEQALKKANFTEIMAGLERYQAYCYQQGREQKYIMHASTWLQNEGWQDAYIIHENQQQQEVSF